MPLLKVALCTRMLCLSPQTDRVLTAAEEIVGPYIWGHYDLLILPPSFPYGGMENPCLTFVSPTVLVSCHQLLIHKQSRKS